MAAQTSVVLTGIREVMNDPSKVFTKSNVIISRDVGLPSSDGSTGGGAILVYTMRARLNGVSYVTWENFNTPDKTGTGPNAPVGTLTDIGVLAKENRVV